MSHVPLFAHGNARDVLIIGGGDCGIAEEVLKHKTVKRLTQVEIDANVVEFAKEHFPEFTKPVFADKRFECVIDDGAKYVAKTERRFDVIIVNSTDPQGPGKILFSEKFYAACRRCLNKGGVLVTQNGVPFFQPSELTSTMSQVPQAVRGRHLLCRRNPDLCGRPHGHGLCHRRQAAAAAAGGDHRRSATAGPAAFQPGIGRRKSTSPRSRSRASSPNGGEGDGSALIASRLPLRLRLFVSAARKPSRSADDGEACMLSL